MNRRASLSPFAALPVTIALITASVLRQLQGRFTGALARTLLFLPQIIPGAAAGVAWTSEPGKRFFVYAQESTTETKKVVWPNRKETLQTTGIVFAFVVVMAIFLWLTDKSLEWVLYDLVLGWK